MADQPTHLRPGGIPQDEDRGAKGGAPTRIPPPPREELDRLRGRDPDALASFFDRYFDRIFRIAFRLLGDRSLAEDVTQDVFLKIHRGVGGLDPDRDPQPWVTTIVCNACREHWRGRHHRASTRSVSIEEMPESDRRQPIEPGNPETELVRAEQHERLREAVLELPESLREVVLLRDFQGLGHQEIAAALGTTHAAVRKRYSRALAELGKRMKDWME